MKHWAKTVKSLDQQVFSFRGQFNLIKFILHEQQLLAWGRKSFNPEGTFGLEAYFYQITELQLQLYLVVWMSLSFLQHLFKPSKMLQQSLVFLINMSPKNDLESRYHVSHSVPVSGAWGCYQNSVDVSVWLSWVLYLSSSENLAAYQSRAAAFTHNQLLQETNRLPSLIYPECSAGDVTVWRL